MVNQYEPRDIYERRTQQVASYLSTVRAAQPLAAPEPQKLPWWKKGLSTTFDYMGRPLAATSSALAAGLRGEDVGTGFMQGLRGQGDIHNIEDVLKQQGVGELGSVNILGQHLTGRGALGFLGNIPADPVTAVTLPFGGGGSLLMRGVRGLTPGLAKGIEAAPLVGGLLGAGKAAAQPVENVISRAYESAQAPLSGMEKVLSKPSGTPKVGGIYRSVMSVINPKIAAGNDTIARARVALGKISNEADPIVQSMMAPLQLQAKQGGKFGVGVRDIFDYSADDGGTVLLASGKRVPARWALTDRHAAEWTPEQKAFVETFRKQNEPLYELARKMGVNFDEYDLPENPGYFPGQVDMEATSRYRRRVGLTVPGTLRERSIKEPGQAKAAGIVYTDPMQSAEWHFKGLIMAIANKQLAEQLAPLAKGAAEMMKPLARQHGNIIALLDTAKSVAYKLKAGQAFGDAETKAVRRIRNQFPDIADSLQPGASAGSLDDVISRANEQQALWRETQPVGREVQDLPSLKGQWFTMEDAQRIEDAFLPAPQGSSRAKVGAALGLGQDLSSVMRTTMSGADMSAPMIQGLLALARNPGHWMGSFKIGMQALFDPQTHARLLASEEAQRVRQLIPNLYFSKGGGEFFAGIRPAEAALRKLPGVGGPLATGVEQIFGRGGAAFDAVGDYLRIKQGLPLAEMAQRYGRDSAEVGEFLNKMTGVSSVSGLPPNWSKFEGGMLLFAPRYTRSSMALVLDAMTRGDMVGSEARATLAQTLGFGLAWYTKVAELAGQEAHLDPSKSNFLSVKVGDDVVGIGSIWISMAKLLGRIAQEPLESYPSNWDELTKDNPITQWWRGRGSPVGAMLYDKLIAGQDFVGAPLDSPVDMARNLGSKFLPFTLDAYLMQQGQQADIKSLPAQLTGFRTFPAPKSEWRETVSQELYQKPYAELDPVAQAKVEQDSRVKNIPAPVGERGERQRALGEIYDTYNNSISKLADDVAGNRRTKNQFRLAVAGLNHDRSIRMESVPERKAGGTRQPTAQEAARKQYYDIMGQTDEENKPNFEGAESYLAGLPSSYVAYIEQKEMAGIERLPENARDLMRERLEARRVTAPYWEIQDTILKKYGIDTTGMSPAEQLAMQDTPRYKAALKEVKAKREQMRRQNPAIERAISEWYGRVALAARRS